MDHSEFRVIVAALLVAFVAHRGYYTRKAQRAAATVREQPTLGRASQVANVLALPAFAATLVYILWPAWMEWSALPLPLWSRWMGVAVALAGFILLQWSQTSLGASWSDTPRFMEGQKLVTRGPYRWVRHPIYTAFLLILGSLFLITANWFIGLMWIAMTALDVAARMRAEEAMMLGQFGAPYEAYLGRTGRLLPRILAR